MATQYVFAGMLILGGVARAWAGPDHGVCEDGTPFPPNERLWVRVFGVGMVLFGSVVLTAALLGFRGQSLDGAPTP